MTFGWAMKNSVIPFWGYEKKSSPFCRAEATDIIQYSCPKFWSKNQFMMLTGNAFWKLNVLWVTKKYPDLATGPQKINKYLGLAINNFGKFLENHPPRYQIRVKMLLVSLEICRAVACWAYCLPLLVHSVEPWLLWILNKGDFKYIFCNFPSGRQTRSKRQRQTASSVIPRTTSFPRPSKRDKSLINDP